jgi:hypothetical protein
MTATFKKEMLAHLALIAASSAILVVFSLGIGR